MVHRSSNTKIRQPNDEPAAGLANQAGFNSSMERACAMYPFISDSFPFKLHLLLAEAEQRGFDHVVAWKQCGRCFVVCNKNEFMKHFLSNYFRSSRFESFRRQLNLYGFHRLTTGPDKGGFYHESFIRGRLDLCATIQLRKVKEGCEISVPKPGLPTSGPVVSNSSASSTHLITTPKRRVTATVSAAPDLGNMGPLLLLEDDNHIRPVASTPATATARFAPITTSLSQARSLGWPHSLNQLGLHQRQLGLPANDQGELYRHPPQTISAQQLVSSSSRHPQHANAQPDDDDVPGEDFESAFDMLLTALRTVE